MFNEKQQRLTTYHFECFVQWLVLDVVADKFPAPLPRVQFRIWQCTSSDSRRHEFLHTRMMKRFKQITPNLSHVIFVFLLFMLCASLRARLFPNTCHVVPFFFFFSFFLANSCTRSLYSSRSFRFEIFFLFFFFHFSKTTHSRNEIIFQTFDTFLILLLLFLLDTHTYTR